MHSSIYKLITSHTCYSQIHKTLPTCECTCYFSALCCAVYPKAQATDSFTPGSNSSRQMTRVSRALSQYGCHLYKISTSSTQNINVTNINKMSSTQDINTNHTQHQCHPHDINVIHTKYKWHSHKLSMSSTHDINVIHTKYKWHSHKLSMSSTHDVNLIHTLFQCHSHEISMLSTRDVKLHTQNINVTRTR